MFYDFFFSYNFIKPSRLLTENFQIYSQFSSVTQSCLTLCDPMDCSTPGLPVYHQLQDFTQTHVHWVSDAIQPSRPLSSPSPPAFNLSQHQGRFQWVSSSHQVAKILELCGFRKGQTANQLPNYQFRDQIANSHWVRESKGIPEKHLLLLHWLCLMILWITTNCGNS